MTRRASVRLAAVLTILVTGLAGLLVVASPASADQVLPDRAVNAEVGRFTYLTPASPSTKTWTVENEIPSWLGGVGTGQWNAGTGYAEQLAFLVQDDSVYGQTVRLEVAEHTDSDGVWRYDLYLTVGQGSEVAEPVQAAAVAGATTRIAAAGDRTGQWVAEGGPAWLDGQSVDGGLDTSTGYRFLHLTVPDGIPVGTEATTTVVEQQRDEVGNDLGQVRREVTLTVMPQLEQTWPTIQAGTTVVDPLVLDGRATEVRELSALEVRQPETESPAQGRTTAEGMTVGAAGQVTFQPGLAQGGKTVDLSWQLGYAGVLGADVPRRARVSVTYVPGIEPKVDSSAHASYVQAGRSARLTVPLSAQADPGERLWALRLRGMQRTADPLGDEAPSVSLTQDGEKVQVRVPKGTAPGSYRLMAGVTDLHGYSGSTRVGVVHVVQRLKPKARNDRFRLRARRWTQVNPLRNDLPGATLKGASARDVSGVRLRVVTVTGPGRVKVAQVRLGKRKEPRLKLQSHRPGSTVKVRYEVTNVAGKRATGVIRARITR